MTTENPVIQLTSLLRSAFVATENEAVADTLRNWPDTVPATVHQLEATSLPVLSYLATINTLASADHQRLTAALESSAPDLSWRQTYSESDFGAAFLQRYGWSILVGPDAPIRNETMLAGFLVLGPEIEYPTHKHQAEEIYLVISGTASWKLGENDWAPLPPGTVVHNTPWREHAMRTDLGEPLLAAFIWRASAVKKSVIV